MAMRVIGSSASNKPVHQNDSRVQDQGASDRDSLPHAAQSRVGPPNQRRSQDPPRDPAAVHAHIVLVAGHTLAFQAERDVVKDGSMVKAGVILENHAAVGAGDLLDAFPITSTKAEAAWMLRTQFLQLEPGGGSCSGRCRWGPGNTDELRSRRPCASTTKVTSRTNREPVFSPHIESLGWAPRVSTTWGPRTSPGRANAIEHPANANCVFVAPPNEAVAQFWIGTAHGCWRVASMGAEDIARP